MASGGSELLDWLEKLELPNALYGETAHHRSKDLSLPDSLTVRECRVRIEQPGFRVTTLVIATTLLDAEASTKSDLAELYRAR